MKLTKKQEKEMFDFYDKKFDERNKIIRADIRLVKVQVEVLKIQMKVFLFIIAVLISLIALLFTIKGIVGIANAQSVRTTVSVPANPCNSCMAGYAYHYERNLLSLYACYNECEEFIK